MKRSCSVCAVKDHRRVKMRKPKKGRNRQPVLAHHACVPFAEPKTRAGRGGGKTTAAKKAVDAQQRVAPKRRRLLRRKKDDG